MRLLIVLHILLSINLLAGMNDDIYTILFENYGESSEITHSNFKIDADLKKSIESVSGQSFFRDNLHCYKIKTTNNKEYVGILDNVYGKTQPITFLVVYNSEGKIDACFIVKYRESRGHGVKQQSWLKQFAGKDIHSEFKPGADIQGITGSTISVNSVSKGVKKLSLLLEEIKAEL